MTPLTFAAPALRDPASIAVASGIKSAITTLSMIFRFELFATNDSFAKYRRVILAAPRRFIKGPRIRPEPHFDEASDQTPWTLKNALKLMPRELVRSRGTFMESE